MDTSPAFQQFHYAGLEPSMACDVVYGAHFEHRLLVSGQAAMEHRRLALGDVVLESGSYDFPVVARGVMPREAVCLGLMAEGGATTRLNTASSGADETQIYPQEVDLLYHAATKSRWVNFAVPEERLQQAATAYMDRPLDLPKRDAAWVQLSRGRCAHLLQLVDDAFAIGKACGDTGISAALGAAISRGLVDGYVAALCEANGRVRRQNATVRQHFQLLLACEHIAASGEVAEMDLDSLALRSGYTRRSLELIFNGCVDMPPGRWFMNIRLNGALRDLLASPEIRVADLAARWGFRHIPRFSAYYRRAFGELPSVTQRRAHG